MRTYGQKDVYAKEEELFGGITYEEPTENDLKLIYGMLLTYFLSLIISYTKSENPAYQDLLPESKRVKSFMIPQVPEEENVEENDFLR